MSTDDMTTRLTKKGQATIPKELREAFDLEAGDELLWRETENGIVVRKATGSGARGMLVDDDVPEEKRKEVAEEMTEKIREKRRTDWQPE